MTTDTRQAFFATLKRILRPFIRILLRNGISYGTFADFAKFLFVDIAMRDFAIEGRKQSISRVSVITGLNRKEVKRVYQLPQPDDQASAERYNRAARVIAGWRRDRDFLTKNGKPATLLITGKGATFEGLVKRYSGDMPFRAILDELIRVGAASRTKTNRIRLLIRAYLPESDESMKIHILGTDAGHLISSIGHNLQPDERGPFFQRKVMYDNLPNEALPQFRKFSTKLCQQLLEKLDNYLSKHDRDVNSSIKGTGRNTAGIGIYYFEERTSKKE
ncbi:MAG: hypothetical protein JSV31_16495 [Desulfobacterales bacterium]|nr:MAG: hypothetical protein JSV31_16495 [Desulfobacterales bacterium]